MRWTPDQYQEYLRRQGLPQDSGVPVPIKPVKKKTEPNETEILAMALLNRLCRLEFGKNTESFPVLGGTHEYTPDLVSEDKSMYVEVKGQYIHNRGSRILFDAFRAEKPWLDTAWMQRKTKGKKGLRWELEFYGRKK